MMCTRVDGCLKEKTKNWAHPVECRCEIYAKLEASLRRHFNAIQKAAHLSAVEFVNQNGRGNDTRRH